MIINSPSLLDKTVQITPEGVRMRDGLLEREVTRDDSEWAAVCDSVCEKVWIKSSSRQHKESKSDCRTLVQQLLSSIPQSVFMRTSYKTKEQKIGTQMKTVIFEVPNHGLKKVESKNSKQEKLSDTEGSG